MTGQAALRIAFLASLLAVSAAAFAQQSAPGAEVGTEPLELPADLTPEAMLLARLSGLFDAEDPTSIYSFELFDDEVEFLVDGTWELNLDSSATIQIDKGVAAAAFSPPVFSQSVSLETWLFLNDTWYFESSFAEEFTRNTVAAGYTGGDDSTIRHVRLGNSGIVFPDAYPLLSVGGGNVIAPGVMGTFAGKNWNADAVVRYDTAASRELLLSGMNEVTDEYTAVTAPQLNKWFALPVAPVTGTVRVYVVDDKGTVSDGGKAGRRWRELNQAEFSVSGLAGTLTLTDSAPGGVAVVYGGSDELSASPGSPLSEWLAAVRQWFSDSGLAPGLLDEAAPDTSTAGGRADAESRFILTIDGNTALVLKERGRFSPFVISSRYAVSGGEIEIVHQETGTSPSGLAVSAFDESRAEIIRTDADAPESGRSPSALFPLAKEFPLLYLPSFAGEKPDTDLSVRSRSYKTITSITLGDNVIDGTVRVTRNGIADTAFRFDEGSGTLTLDRKPATGESVRITWLDSDTSARNATVTLAGGVRWNPAPPLTLDTAAAFRWNLSKTGYTDEAESSPGSFLFTAGAAWARDGVKASTVFALDASVADTTGFYRILGMDSRPVTRYPDTTWYTSLPSPIVPDLTAAGAIALDASGRVECDGSDGETLPSVTVSSVSGSVLDLECELTAPGQWTAADIAAGSVGNVDFSAARTVSLALRNTGSKADFDLYIQLGTGSSDLYESPTAIRTWKVDAPEAGGAWTVRTILLSDADRLAISSGTDLRLVAVPSATLVPEPSPSNPVEIRLQSGPIEITGTGFTAVQPDSLITSPANSAAGASNFTVTETADPASVPLSEKESSIIRRFNNSATNMVLKAEFRPEGPAQTFAISRKFPAVDLSSYAQFSFFLYCETLPAAAGSSIGVILDSPGSSRGAAALKLEIPADSLTLQAGQWHRVTVDLADRTVSVDDALVPGAASWILGIDRSVDPTRVSVSFADWPDLTTLPAEAYTVCLDEFWLGESSAAYSIRNESAFSWKREGVILGSEAHPLVSDARVSVTGTAQTDITDFVSGGDNADESTGVTLSPVYSGTADGSATLWRAKIAGGLTSNSSTGRAVETANHALRIPLGPLELSETFKADFAGNSYSRSNAATVAGPLTFAAATSVRGTGSVLDRSVSFVLEPTLPGLAGGGLSLRLDSAFAQSGSADIKDIGDSAWNGLWLDSLAQGLSCGDTDALKRTGTTTVHAGWARSGNPNGLAGITCALEGISSYSYTSYATPSSSASFTLGAPVRIGITTVTPSWKRFASRKTLGERGGNFISDTRELAEAIGSFTWLYRTVPIADLFDQDIPESLAGDGLWSNSFVNRYGIAWGRPGLGTLTDLWLPATLDASVQRTTEADATAANVEDGWKASVKTGFSAMNIAGAWGAHPVFSWYEQDEFTQLYGWTALWGAGYFTWSLDCSQSALFLFGSSGTLTADNTVHYDSPDISGDDELIRDTFRLVWKRPARGIPFTVFVTRWTRAPIDWRREDTVGVAVTSSDGMTLSGDWDHLLKTGIGENAVLNVTGGAGFARGIDGETTITLRLGVGLALTY